MAGYDETQRTAVLRACIVCRGWWFMTHCRLVCIGCRR